MVQMRSICLLLFATLANCGGRLSDDNSTRAPDGTTADADAAADTDGDTGTRLVDTGRVAPVPACAAGAWGKPGKWEQYGHTATRLPNGKILTLGGHSPDLLAWLLDPATMTWSSAGSFRSTSDLASNAVLLPDGKVFVIDGASPKVKLVDPVAGTSLPLTPLPDGRGNAAAVLLKNGRVLVVGGSNLAGESAEQPAVLYHPTLDRWSPTPIPLVASSIRRARATLLQDGSVLVMAQLDGGAGDLTQSTFVYFPGEDRWQRVGEMKQRRDNHTVTLLPDGRVLAAGGGSTAEPLLSTAEIYDPKTRSWKVVAPMAYPRGSHTATLLPCGGVLVVDGFTGFGEPPSAEIYDPRTDTWSSAAKPSNGHSSHTATLLPDGSVVVIGVSVEVFRN